MNEKLVMHSTDIVNENIKKIGALFPNCMTEKIKEDGTYETGIDFDALKKELSAVIVEGREERYQFVWPDKSKSILLANAPISATLRPCREESVDFDHTENLYIEGDNLDVLKLLQETYLGAIKMIYIDPPYNTGNDFVYRDNFSMNASDYMTVSGQTDKEGNRLVQNTESNGRFHTNWLNMLYPRLKLAKNLLHEDGFIFISIGEEELSNLLRLCSEIFGEQNFRNIIATRRYDKNLNLQFADNGLSTMNVGLEYIVVYSRNPDTKMQPVYRESSKEERTQCGYWKGFWNNADRPTMRYAILGVKPQEGQWKWKREIAEEAVHNYETYIQEFSSRMTLEEYWIQTGKNKRFIRRSKEGKGKNCGVEHWVPPANGILRNSNWSDMLISRPTGVEIPFDSPKNPDVIRELTKLCYGEDFFVLDFFSGSASTAHAVMLQNKEDGGNRKFIMVQLPEETDEKTEAYKAGFKNICEIGKERIRRTGAKIKEESPLTTADLDVGFRVLKLDSSNMKDVYYNPSAYSPTMFESLADNIKEDRSPEDLLFQVMLDLGILLSSKIEETAIAGKKVFSVADKFLIACFDADLTDEVITEIAKQKPYYFVTRDHSMASDSVATNFDQIFATYSPDTVRKVL